MTRSSFYRGKVAQTSFERSRAEEKFAQALKADKNFVANKAKETQVKLDKMAKLKALRLAKELANLHGVN